MRRVRRLGWVVLLGSLAVLGAALNTGNNLLHLLGSLGLASLLVSWMMSKLMLRRTRVLVQVEGEPVAGELIPVELTTRASLPYFGTAGLLLRVGSGERLAIPHVPSGPAGRHVTELDGRARGVSPLELELACLFPLGMVEARRPLSAPELLVLPRALPAPDGTSAAGAERGAELARRGPGTELDEVRPWQDGDEPRRIDWKTTARRGELMVREHLDETQRRAVVIVDLSSPTDEPAEEERVEKVVSWAADAVQRLELAGLFVELVLPSGRHPGNAREHLRQLARLQAPRPGSLAAGWWRGQVDPDENPLLLSTGAAA
ncbi:MAG: DUF58 domain-containing protein [Acidobacteriota bacterium]